MNAIAWPFGALKQFSYELLMVDPAWPVKMRSPKGEAKSAAAKYGLMSIAEISAMPVGELAAKNAVLFTWAVWPLVLDGGDPDRHYIGADASRSPIGTVIKAWGARFVTGGAWFKRTVTGKPAFGPGYRGRSTCEPFLLSIFGNPDSRGARRSRNAIESIVDNAFDGLRREHSRKPEEAFTWCENYLPGVRRCELFSRQSRPGWDTWGREAGKFDPVVTLNAAPAAARTAA